MNKLFTLLALLLLLCSHSWGACRVQYGPYSGTRTCNPSVSTSTQAYCEEQLSNGCSDINNFNLLYGFCYTSASNASAVGSWSGEPYCEKGNGGYWYIKSAYTNVYCLLDCNELQVDSIQHIIDSVYCEQNPTAAGCAVETDTTLFACSDSFSGNGGLYRLSCKALNGEVISCNGKTSIDIATDGTLVRPLQGTCAQNGFGTGIIGGATADTASPQSANADCFAIIGSTCHMKDKVSGNTFTCDCDGSCNVALRNLMAGNANCQNPYPQPSSSDGAVSLPFQSSSSASSSPSSSEGGSSGGTSSGDGTSSSSDFEFDYTEVLDNIRANTQQTATEVGRSNEFLNDIKNNTYTANGLLQQLVNKDWNPTIDVHTSYSSHDTNIVNVEVNGDTAHAPAEILSFLKDTTGIGGYADQFTNERDEAIRRGDSLLSATSSFIDSVEGSFPNIDYSDSIGSAVQGVNSALATLKDTIDNSAISDSMTRWEGIITDNGVITGDGSSDCPSILTQTYTWEFPMGNSQVNVNVPALGQYLCTPITGVNITLWALARVLLRAIVAIGCMIWIYKAVMGIDESGEGE